MGGGGGGGGSHFVCCCCCCFVSPFTTLARIQGRQRIFWELIAPNWDSAEISGFRVLGRKKEGWGETRYVWAGLVYLFTNYRVPLRTSEFPAEKQSQPYYIYLDFVHLNGNYYWRAKQAPTREVDANFVLSSHIWLFVGIYIYFLYVYVYIYIYICRYIYICMLYMYVYTYVGIYIFVCYICRYIYMYLLYVHNPESTRKMEDFMD